MIWDALISAAVIEERPLKTTAIQATMGSIYNHWVLHRFLVQDRPSASKNRGRGARKGTEHNNRLFYAVVKLYDEWIAQCELCTLLGTWNVPFEKIGAKSVLDKDLRVRRQKNPTKLWAYVLAVMKTALQDGMCCCLSFYLTC